MDTTAEIERLSRLRQEIWDSKDISRSEEATRIGARLTDLYELKRHEASQALIGATRREDIVRRARVESELERLMSERVRG